MCIIRGLAHFWRTAEVKPADPSQLPLEQPQLVQPQELRL